MNFLKTKKRTTAGQPPTGQAEVLHGLQLCCTGFQKNIQDNALFDPEFKTAQHINSILEAKGVLGDTDVAKIISLLKGMETVEHYNGSGWLDYKMRLNHYLRLQGYTDAITV